MTDSYRKCHREWRKDAKKARRKRIRQQLALFRKEKEKERENSPTYLLELEKKRLYEEFILEKEAKESEEKNKKWLEEEERAQKKWREEQRLKELTLEQKQKEQEKIRKEWEQEQKKIREQKERLEALEKEEKERQQQTLDRITDFIYNGGDLPAELRIVTETNPGKEICSFYQKVGACRFGNQCSRNHFYYQISNILLFSNFYNHFKLDQSKSSEYDTDIGLEYEDSDMYLHFKEFYNDIVPEFSKFGEVTMLKVCCNTEIHLRGNVYVEYATEREAMVVYQKFQGRWYGGKQLHIEFVKITDWGSAVCGDFVRRRCPKGKSCNFLHVFRNPRNEFAIDWNKKKINDDYDRMRSRSWRWSESPSPSIDRIKESTHVKIGNGQIKKGSSERRRRSRSSERKRRRSRSSERQRRRSRSSERKRKRFRSSERKRRKSKSPEEIKKIARNLDKKSSHEKGKSSNKEKVEDDKRSPSHCKAEEIQET